MENTKLNADSSSDQITEQEIQDVLDSLSFNNEILDTDLLDCDKQEGEDEVSIVGGYVSEPAGQESEEEQAKEQSEDDTEKDKSADEIDSKEVTDEVSGEFNLQTRRTFANALGSITSACSNLSLAIEDFQNLILPEKTTAKHKPYAGFECHATTSRPMLHTELFQSLNSGTTELMKAFEATKKLATKAGTSKKRFLEELEIDFKLPVSRSPKTRHSKIVEKVMHTSTPRPQVKNRKRYTSVSDTSPIVATKSKSVAFEKSPAPKFIVTSPKVKSPPAKRPKIANTGIDFSAMIKKSLADR